MNVRNIVLKIGEKFVKYEFSMKSGEKIEILTEKSRFWTLLKE